MIIEQKKYKDKNIFMGYNFQNSSYLCANKIEIWQLFHPGYLPYVLVLYF